MMFFSFLTILGLLSFIPRIFCFNALLVSIGHAGHVIPLFELAKALKNHNVTFVTQPLAKSYINSNVYPNTSSFRIIYSNESVEAFKSDKEKTQKLISYSANHSFFDGIGYSAELLSDDINSLLNKTIHILMDNQFDVIIANSLVSGVHILCKQANASCVIQTTESIPNLFSFNFPNTFSLLSREQITQTKYRLYNVIYTLHVSIIFIRKLLPTFFSMNKSFPKVPGPFYESFSMSNMLLTESKCLELYSISPTFNIPTYPNHYKKYLGAFIDETTIKYQKNELTDWILSKPNESIIYGAFGTSSLIKFDRMKNLINGLTEFLFKISNVSLLLVFHGENFQTYQSVLNDIKSNEYSNILMDNQRVRIENKFVEQKWILQQKSIKLFLSHCGMGSCSEGIYFQKPILCMPFNMDQFIISITVEHLEIGLSLFISPSLFQSLLHPYDFYNYTFSANSVTTKLLKIWENDNYQNMVTTMSIEMKHAGGLKRAVEEIELLVHLKGNLDRYAPFQSTLPFYQRYMLDLITIFIILPVITVRYLFKKCFKRQRKEKNE